MPYRVEFTHSLKWKFYYTTTYNYLDCHVSFLSGMKLPNLSGDSTHSYQDCKLENRVNKVSFMVMTLLSLSLLYLRKYFAMSTNLLMWRDDTLL